METIVQWFLDNFPWLAPTAVCCYIAWKLSAWVKNVDNTMNKHDESLSRLEKIMEQLRDGINKLPCGTHMTSIEKHEERITKEEEGIRSTNDRIDNILLGMSMGVTSSSKKESPYRLTEFGEYILSESKGKECVEANKSYLFDKIEKGLHSTPYDVERAALRAVLDMFNTEKANDVKNYIYNAPDTVLLNGKEYRLTQNDVQVAMAIYLRDMYLNGHHNL